MFYFGHAWCIYILPSSCFNLQIRTVKKNDEKKNEKKNFNCCKFILFKKKREEHGWFFSADQMGDEEAGMCAGFNLDS